MLVTGLIIGLLVIGLILGYLVRRHRHIQKLMTVQAQARQIIENATAQTKQKIATLQAKSRRETLAYQQSVKDELTEQKSDIAVREQRRQQREQLLNQMAVRLDDQTSLLDERSQTNHQQRQKIHDLRDQATALRDKRVTTLAEQAAMSTKEAEEVVLQDTDLALKRDRDIEVKALNDDAEANAEKWAKDVVLAATESGPQDLPKEHLEHTVTVPNGEVRSKIIGRDGQHIRLLETLTGTDLIFVPDDNSTLFISTHDPIRREVARTALTNLIASRRISANQIETQVENAQRDVNHSLWEVGEQAVSRLHVGWMHPDLMKLIGRLKYRTSYGQNVLQHSIEVSQLAGAMAARLGYDARLARRAGLLHDLGKSIDHEVEGTHVEIGTEFAEKYGEDPIVINAIAAHHGDVEKTSPISALVAAADAISGARQGARSESVEDYINRLRSLEKIANDRDGVTESYAIQAGRELRIIVNPQTLDDHAAANLTQEVAQQVEKELTYPGKIRITTIRKLTAVEYVGDEKKKKKKKKKAANAAS
ncbi:ribonuclease Y [Levilactobacillus spicheri]|uniref:Ribonuclease Y n=2 Tax=Levilactobacillus spicheri TaxID=216463 RepID=A0ABQ0WS54_9LACO|nr:ribonuclease Y [Levilactobacillus spicheri]KRL47414.1 HD superfamily hydrolase [Levilactobacillus spicheri DSM 15429]GEO67846.1 ribonuclease Y [Levilactobacillus spicheri]